MSARPGQRVYFVMANAGQLDAGAVDIELPAFDLDLAKTDLALDALQHLAVFSQFDHQLVKVGLFGIPLEGIGTRDLRLTALVPG